MSLPSSKMGRTRAGEFAGTLQRAFANGALIDTSAAIALTLPQDALHEQARASFESLKDLDWFVLNVTSHESFSRCRYDHGLQRGMEVYERLRGSGFTVLDFGLEDEVGARDLLARYHDQSLSFHDALCAAVMLRVGLFKVFTFDADFWLFGFEVLPGTTVVQPRHYNQ